jgi:hypothetical protein
MIIFSIVLSFIKINQSISVNGLIIKEKNYSIFEFNVMEKNFNKIEIGTKIELYDNSTKKSIDGEISKMNILDFGLDEGRIIEYKVKIGKTYTQYTMNKFYSINIILKNKTSLIQIIFNKVINN